MASQPVLPTLEDFLKQAQVAPRKPFELVVAPGRPQSSPQQKAVFRWVQMGKGNAIVIAVAGSGKTTTLLGKVNDEGVTLLPGAVDYMTGSVAVVAYGKKNSEEFAVRLGARGIDKRRVRSGTAHSFGFSGWRQANPGVAVDEKEKWNAILNRMVTEGSGIPEYLQTFVKQLISLAKQRAIGVLTPISNRDAWFDIVDHFDLETNITLDDPDVSFDEAVMKGVELASHALQISNDLSKRIIDFDDMPYMPLVGNCRLWQNDWLLVDEAQDTNPCRRLLYRRMLKREGRAIFVGDPAQAIYGFTGADNDSLDLIRKEFGCTDLPLTVTYRCPKAVVRWAQAWVSHIEAHESNIEGEVKTIELDDFLKITKELKPQDAIICRNTKPLVELAFKLIRQHIACHVEGKEIGQGLLSLVNRWRVTSLDTLEDRLSKFLAKQTAKLKELGKDESAAALADKVETVFVMLRSLPAGSKVQDLRNLITSMFSDSTKNLTLCTAHKSKGLEWGDVYLLGRNKFMPSPWAKQQWQQEQEDHLCYVAGTRAMKRLIEINVPVQERKREQ